MSSTHDYMHKGQRKNQEYQRNRSARVCVVRSNIYASMGKAGSGASAVAESSLVVSHTLRRSNSRCASGSRSILIVRRRSRPNSRLFGSRIIIGSGGTRRSRRRRLIILLCRTSRHTRHRSRNFNGSSGLTFTRGGSGSGNSRGRLTFTRGDRRSGKNRSRLTFTRRSCRRRHDRGRVVVLPFPQVLPLSIQHCIFDQLRCQSWVFAVYGFERLVVVLKDTVAVLRCFLKDCSGRLLWKRVECVPKSFKAFLGVRIAHGCTSNKDGQSQEDD